MANIYKLGKKIYMICRMCIICRIKAYNFMGVMAEREICRIEKPRHSGSTVTCRSVNPILGTSFDNGRLFCARTVAYSMLSLSLSRSLSPSLPRSLSLSPSLPPSLSLSLVLSPSLPPSLSPSISLPPSLSPLSLTLKTGGRGRRRPARQ